MRRTASFWVAFACAALGMLLAVLAAALITSRSSTERGNLDRMLATTAGEKAALVESELERVQALTLITSRVPPFAGLYANPGSAGAALHQIDTALQYVWELYPDRVVEDGYVDASGRENARVVGGQVTPEHALGKDISSWPSFNAGITTPVGAAWVTEPFISPTARIPVLATTTAVWVNGRVRAYVELELAIDALSRVLSEDVDQRKVGVAIVNGAGIALVGAGRRFRLRARVPRGGLSTIAGWRVAVRPIYSAATPRQWFVVAMARPASALGVVGPAVVSIIVLALLLLAIASYGFARARADSARELATEQRARADAERRSRIDPLTGLFNRRHALETIEQELARSGREGSLIGLLMCDVDRFKQVNDQHGHAAGDAVLIEIGRRLRTGVRVFDMVARVGGEEFCVVAPGVHTEDEVAELGDRLRQAVADRAAVVRGGVALPVTISVGATLLHADEGSAENAFDRSDRALYAAKRRGRNMLCRYSELDRDDVRAEQPECLHIAEALAVAQDLREGMASEHSREVADLSAAVARRLGLPDDEVLRVHLGGWLHDVGKVAVGDGILCKRGPLTDAEWESMRKHPAAGEELVRHLPELALAAKAVRHHHERFDGAGYPDRLAGEDIPLEARIVAVVDAYSAMTSDRPYKKACSHNSAIDELRRCAGTHFDPAVVEALLEEFGQRDSRFAGTRSVLPDGLAPA